MHILCCNKLLKGGSAIKAKISKKLGFFINASMLALAGIAMRAVVVCFNAYIASRLGGEGMGVLSLVMTVYGFAVTVATSGVNLSAVRLTSSALARGDVRLSSVMKACASYSLIFGVSTGVLLYISAPLIGEYLLDEVRCVPSLRALAVSMPAISLTSALSGYFTGIRKVYKNVIVSISEQFFNITVTSAALVVISARDVGSACLAVVGGGALAQTLSFVCCAVFYIADSSRREQLGNESCGISEVAAISLPVAVGSYARQGLTSLEHLAIPWCLRHSGADRESALASYGAMQGMALPVILFPSAVVQAFSGVLIPEISEAAALKDEDKLRSVSVRVFGASLIFSVFVSFIMSSYYYELGMSIYGNVEAAEGIRMLAPLIPIMYLDTSVDAVLKGLGEQLYSMKINMIDAASGVVLVLLLVPSMKIEGYVAAIYICEIVNAAFSIARLLKVLRVKLPLGRLTLPPLISASLSIGAVKLADVLFHLDSVAVQIGAALAVYALIIRVLQKRELAVSF